MAKSGNIFDSSMVYNIPFFFRRTVYYYPRMDFDDIRVFRSRVISKLFCVRGNCYGNFNGQTTGGCHEHAESCRRFEIVHKRLQHVSGAELLLHRETIHSGIRPKSVLQRREIAGSNLLIIYRYRPSKTECLIQISSTGHDRYGELNYKGIKNISCSK